MSKEDAKRKASVLTAIFAVRIVDCANSKTMRDIRIKTFAFTYRFSFREADWRTRVCEGIDS